MMVTCVSASTTQASCHQDSLSSPFRRNAGITVALRVTFVSHGLRRGRACAFRFASNAASDTHYPRGYAAVLSVGGDVDSITSCPAIANARTGFKLSTI